MRISATQADDVEERCVKCGYSLRTLDPAGVCPECGLPVADSLLSKEDRFLLRREDRILSRMEWYRRNRSGAIALAFIAGLGMIVLVAIPAKTSSVPVGLELMLFSAFVNLVFWSAVAYANHARYQHAQSIALHRRHSSA